MFLLFTKGRGRAAFAMMFAVYLIVVEAFNHFKSSFYMETHLFSVNGIALIAAGTVCFGYACLLIARPPKDSRLKLRDPNTGEFRPLEPMSHEVYGVPIELLGPLLILLGGALWAWEWFHPAF